MIPKGKSKRLFLHLLMAISPVCHFHNLPGQKSTISTVRLQRKPCSTLCSKTYTFHTKGSSSRIQDEVKDYLVDVTQKAHENKFDAIVGREKELKYMHKVLLKRTKKNPLLIGEAGVGKTAIVEELAREIVNKKSPDDLLDCRILQLDVTSLMAGTAARGEMEERVHKILDTLKDDKNQEELILFIDEIHILTSKSYRNEMNICDMFKPFLARGSIRCIGATTYSEYEKFFKKDKAFERRFQPIHINEPSCDEALVMMRNVKQRYEEYHNCSIEDEAIVKAVDYAEKYIPYRQFPDKAIDLIDEACSRCVMDSFLSMKNTLLSNENVQSFPSRIVNENTIDRVMGLVNGYDIKHINASEDSRIKAVSDHLSRQIIGQNGAIRAMVDTLRKSTCGLNDPSRPLCSMLFIGPTGVGKTECVKLMTKHYYGHERHLLRFDMSEYMEPLSISTLIGAPPGYLGYDDGGKLTNLVKRNPHSVVLFDEIEKAHPNVLNLLLQIMEDGALTDSTKNTVSFKNCIIVMTSNAGYGTNHCGNQIGFSLGGGDAVNEKKGAVVSTRDMLHSFRPEFINRIDRIVHFNHLTKDDIVEICDNNIQDAITNANRVVNELGYNFVFDVCSETKEAITQLAFNESDYGARPLNRAITTLVVDNIAEHILTIIDTKHQDSSFIINSELNHDSHSIIWI